MALLRFNVPCDFFSMLNVISLLCRHWLRRRLRCRCRPSYLYRELRHPKALRPQHCLPWTLRLQGHPYFSQRRCRWRCELARNQHLVDRLRRSSPLERRSQYYLHPKQLGLVRFRIQVTNVIIYLIEIGTSLMPCWSPRPFPVVLMLSPTPSSTRMLPQRLRHS